MAGQLISTEAADATVVNDYTTLAQNIAKAVYNGTDTTRLTQIDNDVMAAIDLEKQLTQVIAPVDTSSTMWIVTVTLRYAWWRHQMETSSALLALFEGNPPVTVDSSHKGQWAQLWCFLWSAQSRCRWFETRSRSLWRHSNEHSTSIVTVYKIEEVFPQEILLKSWREFIIWWQNQYTVLPV